MTRIAAHHLPVDRSPQAFFHALGASVLTVVRMSRVRLSLMVVATAWFGYAMAAAGDGSAYAVSMGLVALLAGVGFASMGSSVLNQVVEREYDVVMERTRTRPLPAKQVSVPVATAVGLAMSAVGVGLTWTLNAPAAALTAWTVVSYVLIYTPLKRRTTLSTVVGAVPGAIPPVIGVVAVTGALDTTAWVMFAILFLWQLPHFLAIAWRYRDQYEKAGMIVLPVADPSGGSTFRQVVLSSMALMVVGLLPTVLGLAGPVYFFGSLTAGVVLLCFAVALAIGRGAGEARAVFYATLVYLPVVYGLMLMDKV